jgi:dienelactone hydrolase
MPTSSNRQHNGSVALLKPWAITLEMTTASRFGARLMRVSSRSGLILLFLAVSSIAATAQEPVRMTGDGLTLQGVLFRPKGAGPFPAVVGLHGCSGMGNRRYPLDLRFRDWGERLAAAGFAVVFPDSFGSRGEGSQCRVRDRRIRPRVERVGDAIAARRWLQAQSWVKRDRVFLMGWSHGGSTTLWGVRPQARPDDGGPDFRAAVAFYPGCRVPAERGWSARLPTLLLIGADDDWTPPGPCLTLVSGARGNPARVEIKTYPGAYHSFDHPDQKVRQVTGLALAKGGRAHIGTNPAARADAIRRVPEWFKQ